MGIRIVKLLDKVIGALICLILTPFSKKKAISTGQLDKILFIQLWGIGETVLTLPAISAVKKKYNKAEISILCTQRNREVFDSSGMRLNILPVSMNPLHLIWYIITNFRKYSLVFDFEEYLNISSILAFISARERVGYAHHIRSGLYTELVDFDAAKHNMETFLDLVRIAEADSKKMGKLSYGIKESNKIRDLISITEMHIGIVPGAAESAKSRIWPYFAALCNRINTKVKLVFIGTESEKKYIDALISHIKDQSMVLNTAGTLNLKELFCLVDELDLIITNDTGPLHIASAQNTPTIALFGPNLAVRFGPLAENSIAIYKPKACRYSPCINVHKGKVPDCLPVMKRKKKYQACMRSISVNEVFAELEKYIKKYQSLD